MSCDITQELEQLECLLLTCTDNWIQSQDVQGYFNFIRCLELWEHLADHHGICRDDDLNERLLSALRQVYQYIRMKDIIALGDVLQYDMLPIVSRLKEGGESA